VFLAAIAVRAKNLQAMRYSSIMQSDGHSVVLSQETLCGHGPWAAVTCQTLQYWTLATITATAPNEESLKILRLPQVCEVTGLCRSMIYQMEADRRFPQRIKISTRAVGWLETEVNAWLIRRIASSRSETAI
jgi:prophage regulatory protein